VDDYPGIGYLFVISSPEPFDYSSIVRRDQWDYRGIANGRLHSDPYAALSQLADRLAPRGDYDYDLTPYYVERRYAYPRFVCYDCHSYSPTPMEPLRRMPATRYRSSSTTIDLLSVPGVRRSCGGAGTPRPARATLRFSGCRWPGSVGQPGTHRSQSGSTEPVAAYRSGRRSVSRFPYPVVKLQHRTGRFRLRPRRTTGEPELRRRRPDDKTQGSDH
jgi:hypothetical protein